MFSWGEDCQRGFRLKDGPGTCSTAEDGVHHLNLGYQIRDLSAGLNVLAFAKTNGGAFIIRTNENDGRRVRGKQKFVKCKEKFQAVSCGDDMVTLLSEGGRVYSVDTTRPPFNPSPLNTLSNIPVSQVACGSQHSMALTKEGQVYTWGQDSRGQLGLGKRRLGACSPQHLSSLSAIPLVQIAAGGEQSFALSFSGGVFGWGRNDCGQLGLGDTTDRHTPTSVHCLNLKKTVHISCGVDHTAILTKHGAVFTFGSGHYGQLGHNSFSHELRPRLVAELLGANVTQIACGRHHTLVLTDSKKVYSFGCREQGQLGHGEESHPSVPLPVQLPQDSGNVPKIRNIFAGGNCSFATCTPVEEVEAESNTDSVSNVTQQCLDDLIDKWTSQCDSKSWKKTKQEIHRTFSSASCVNKSFLELRKDKHFQTSPKYPGLNLSLARLAFKKLVKKDDVFAEVETAVMQLLQSIEKKPVGVEGLRIFLLLNELLHVIQKHKRQQSTKLAEAVAAAVLSLPDESIQVIGDWWSSLSASTMVKYVKVWKKALSVILSFKPVPRNSGIRNLLQVLQYMYNVNCRIAESRRMPDSDFCLLIDENFLLEDLQLWRSRSRLRSVHTEPLILCSFPIVMDLQSKKLVFDMNAEFTKIETVRGIIQDLFWEFIFFQPNPQHVYLVLDLRRASILDDTFEQLAAAQHNYFKRPLVVCFDAIRTIDAVHTKDFFYEVFHELLSAESGMFMFNDSETLAWFPSNPTREHQRYFLFGVLCGLALYSQCIIHLPFPMALFKKLLGVQPSLEDMMEFSPIVGQSLQYILEDYQDDDLKRLSMDFLIDWDGSKVGLDPENPEKPVTSQNKKAFVDAYVNHAFNTSVESVFQEFKRGFFQMCDRDLVKLFQPKELRKVLVGKDFHDWERLKQNTSYEGEYRVDHPNIQMFWEVFDELTEDQKKAFLWFVTGFERVPIHGLENIKMIVRPKPVGDLSNDQYYPETHTCFSGLELPLYSTQEIMKTKLTEALSNKRRSYK
ncbi:probable E3 ubiquitin-protein ligase HERC4 [Toxotes jaculatrix]|uniref:probable E3 ubiquitin-protein ligase HERC4 n=1 Tax=Toxotes jaculatrix TaxID=941984 RepID=UPI001B3B0EAF|nr:probable E3 ubiquitin-protein ligase HERC4 [Toxotes jaculatrix]